MPAISGPLRRCVPAGEDLTPAKELTHGQGFHCCIDRRNHQQSGNHSSVAAAEIHTLINSQPRSPTKDELAAIIAKATLPAPHASVPRLRAEWDELAAEIRAAMSQEDAAMAACAKLH